MNKTLFTTLLLSVFCFAAIGQALHAPHKPHGSAKTTVADPAEDSYDVKYLKFNLNVTNTSTAISGDVLTRAQVVSAGLTTYVFELDTLLTIDSAKINGNLLPVTTTGPIRSMNFASLPTGSIFTAQVYYHGTTAIATIDSLGGVYNPLDPAWYTNTLFTVSEPYYARNWWPCKQSLRDKIDSVDMWVTVPDSLKVGSNGLLQHITPVDATHMRYEWKERNPIDYYLISIAAGPYTDYSYYMHFTGSTDSMLVQNYVYNDPAFLTTYQGVLDTTGLMIDYFSTIYGRYPFWKEKYGHSTVYGGGAEENQTMTSISSIALDVYVVAHELGHQWFGDNVTCGTWSDIMMNEGFAEYSNFLFIDQFLSHAAALSDMVGYQDFVKSAPNGSSYAYDTSAFRLFDSRLTYCKPPAVLHTLRCVVNNDSAFFHIFQHYQQNLHAGNGTVEDFKNTAKGLLGTVVNGIDLDTFFNQWIYLEGYPMYAVRWYQSGTDVYVKLIQTTSDPTSVSLFKVPIEIQLRSTAGDTVIRVLNDQSTQTYHFTWHRTMNNIFLDPNNWLIYHLVSKFSDPSLGVDQPVEAAVKVLPNPTTNNWTIEQVSANSKLVMHDIAGRVIAEYYTHKKGTITIPGDILTAGSYVLTLFSEDGTVNNQLLIKE